MFTCERGLVVAALGRLSELDVFLECHGLADVLQGVLYRVVALPFRQHWKMFAIDLFLFNKKLKIK